MVLMGRKSGKTNFELKYIEQVMQQQERLLEKMLLMAGFVYTTNESDFRMVSSLSRIEQVERFIIKNRIKFRQDVERFAWGNRTTYTMTKNGEDILFFTKEDKYDKDNFKITTSLSDVIKIK